MAVLFITVVANLRASSPKPVLVVDKVGEDTTLLTPAGVSVILSAVERVAKIWALSLNEVKTDKSKLIVKIVFMVFFG